VRLVDRIRELFSGKRSTGADSTAVVGGAVVASTIHDDDRDESADAHADSADAGGSVGGGWGDAGGGGGDGGGGA
jgi:hypothetical protein